MIICRPTVLAITLCLFFLQTLIANGYMPSLKDGKIAIVICSIEGDKTVYVDADQSPASAEQNHTPSDHSQTQCPYAVFSIAKTFAHYTDIISDAFAFSKIDFQVQTVSLPSGLSTSPYHSRAPPTYIL